jgi:hypothetical protein
LNPGHVIKLVFSLCRQPFAGHIAVEGIFSDEPAWYSQQRISGLNEMRELIFVLHTVVLKGLFDIIGRLLQGAFLLKCAKAVGVGCVQNKGA